MERHLLISSIASKVKQWLRLTDIDDSDSYDTRPIALKQKLKELRQKVLERSIVWYRVEEKQAGVR